MIINYANVMEVNMENSLSLKSNKSRVTFCDLDEIELDSLEPEIQINGEKDGDSDDIDCDNRSDSVSYDDDFDDDELEKFIEFDVSFASFLEASINC